MFLATAFRLSFFITLGLACACLALAESFFLGWIGYFLVGTLVLLVLAYRWEGRWVLSADAANRLGMVIAIGAAFWILFKLPRNEEDLLASGVPWPAGLLPHLGPLLILLLLVKLFRPKRLADFWVIQTIGLMMVTLSCVLAAEPMFGVLLVIYLACLLWSLSLFYLVREEAWSRCSDGKAPDSCPEVHLLSLFSAPGDEPGTLLPWRHLGLVRVAGRTCLVVLLGLALFLVAPRQDNFQWEPKQLTSAAKGFLRTGAGDGGMDLNRVGKIELSEDPAFDVQAQDIRGPKLDLDTETRWYVQTLEYYAQGRWTNWNQGLAPPNLIGGISSKADSLGIPMVEGLSHPRNPPANLEDPDYYLSFKVRLLAAGGLVLAEPLVGMRVGLYPHLGEKALEAASLFFHQVGTDSLLASPHRSRQLYQYGQVLRKQAHPDMVPVKGNIERYRQFLINQDVPEAIGRWVRELLGKLPSLTQPDGPPDAKSPVPVAAHAKVALALTRYLAFSGEFGYSLDLHRYQRDLDPLADFLLNIKEGHCERYAGGLTLMLRSLGIPARVIKGYRGLENLGEGKYLIRQSQAHSWVEVLVEDETETKYWLTLDPTPTTERTVQPLLSWFGWLFQRWTDSDNIWHSYIMEYNADQQERTLDFLQNQLTPESNWTPFLFVLVPGLLLLGVYGGFKIKRRRRLLLNDTQGAFLEKLGRNNFYHRYLKVIHKHLGMKPEPGQTPLEFGLLVQARLVNLVNVGCVKRTRADATGEAGVTEEYNSAKAGASARVRLTHPTEENMAVPLKLVALLYRIRFGGRFMTDLEEREANRHVDYLAAFFQK